MSGLSQNLPLLVIGWAVAAAGACALLLIRRRAGFSSWGLDLADEPRKTHQGVIPRIGGLAIFPACLAVGLLAGQPRVITVGATMMFVIGFGDDLVRLNSRWKLVAQILVAALSFALGLRLETLPGPGGDPVHLPVILSFVLTVGWLVGWTNAMNLIDGVDGLATGIAMIGMLFLATVVPGAALAVGVAGAAAGFLCFNFPRARMFLGDGGAYLFGYLFAAFALLDGNGRGFPFLLTVLAVPLLDTLFAFARRALRGLPVMRGDAEHIHHRLRAIGLSGPVTVLVLHAATIVSGVVAVAAMKGGSGWSGLWWVGLAGAGLAWFLSAGQVSDDGGQNNSANPASSRIVGSETVSSSST